MRKNFKYIIILGFFICLSALSFIYWEPLRNKTFTPEIRDRFIYDGVGSYLLESESIMDSGRRGMRELVHMYLPNTSFWGNGSGSTNGLLRLLNEQLGIAAIMHNDYEVMLIDNGILGLILWITIVAVIFIRIIFALLSPRCSYLTKVLGVTSFSSFAGVSFAMGFDNVIAHSMSSIGIPFLLLGMFYHSMMNDRYEKIS